VDRVSLRRVGVFFQSDYPLQSLTCSPATAPRACVVIISQPAEREVSVLRAGRLSVPRRKRTIYLAGQLCSTKARLVAYVLHLHLWRGSQPLSCARTQILSAWQPDWFYSSPSLPPWLSSMMGWSWVFFAPRLGLAGEDDQSFLDKKEEKEKGKKRSAADSEGPLDYARALNRRSRIRSISFRFPMLFDIWIYTLSIETFLYNTFLSCDWLH